MCSTCETNRPLESLACPCCDFDDTAPCCILAPAGLGSLLERSAGVAFFKGSDPLIGVCAFDSRHPTAYTTSGTAINASLFMTPPDRSLSSGQPTAPKSSPGYGFPLAHGSPLAARRSPL